MRNGNGRKENGRFTRGNAGGPGRPPRAREERYLQTLGEVVSEDGWRRVCERALADAEAGDARARNWLSQYLLPNPNTDWGAESAARQSEVDVDELISMMEAEVCGRGLADRTGLTDGSR